MRERAVRFIRLWFVDVLGMLKSFSIRVIELEWALADGVDLDGSALEGFARLAERDVIAYRDPLGIPVKASHHDVATSQREIKLAHSDGLSMADAVTTFRSVIKKVARKQGMSANFIPKPLELAPSSGMHVHLSVFADGRTVFFDRSGASVLSGTGRAFSGRCSGTRAGVDGGHQPMGQLQQTAGMALRRRLPGSRGPGNSASALVRVPSSRPGREASVRIELRSPDSACKPTRTSASRCCWPPAFAVSSALTSCYPRRPMTPPPPPARGYARTCVRLPIRSSGTELVNETLGEALTGWHVANKGARVGRLPPDGDGVRTTSLSAGDVTTGAANG
ncbi:MAG: glutamine synthetase beta-grasp domain-containing protein [Terriglobales bacterium]